MCKLNYIVVLISIALFSCKSTLPIRESIFKNYDSLPQNELVGVINSGKPKLDTTALVGRIFNGQSKNQKNYLVSRFLKLFKII